MAVNSNNLTKRYRHEDLAADLRQQIRTGALKPGQKMPSLTKLNLELGIPQPTIIRAHDLLEREGLIVRRQGSGTYVSGSTEDSSSRIGTSNISGRSLMILTSFMSPSDSSQHAPGWAMQTSLGMIQQSYLSNLHAVLLKTSHVTSVDLDQLIGSRPFGIIVSDHLKDDISLIHDFWSKLVQSGVPIVAISNMNPEVDCVVSDQEAGAHILTNWLIEKGRRRILCMLPPAGNLSWVSSRRSGYENSMRENGLDPRIIVLPDASVPYSASTEANFDVEVRRYLGYLAEHLVGPNACDAILVPSDGCVSAAARACRLVGKIPNEDVLIAGYDNYWKETGERAWESASPVATVDKHNLRIGHELVSLLVDRVEGRLPRERQIRTVAPSPIVLENGG